MRSLLLFAVASLAVTGCMSSSPTVRTYSANADNLRVRYAEDRGRIAERLLDRGCTAQSAVQYRCTIESQNGPLVVALAFSTPIVSVPTQGPSEATQEYVAERAPAPERYLPEGETYSVAPTRSAAHSLADRRPGVRTSAPVPVLGLHAQAYVFDGDTAILLVGDAAEAVREALYSLLVQDLPVISAYYVD